MKEYDHFQLEQMSPTLLVVRVFLYNKTFASELPRLELFMPFLRFSLVDESSNLMFSACCRRPVKLLSRCECAPDLFSYNYLWLVFTSRYGFGWESQLLETTFLTIFLVPFISLRQFAPACPPSAVLPWLYRWLAFRIMLGALFAAFLLCITLL